MTHSRIVAITIDHFVFEVFLIVLQFIFNVGQLSVKFIPFSVSCYLELSVSAFGALCHGVESVPCEPDENQSRNRKIAQKSKTLSRRCGYKKKGHWTLVPLSGILVKPLEVQNEPTPANKRT